MSPTELIHNVQLTGKLPLFIPIKLALIPIVFPELGVVPVAKERSKVSLLFDDPFAEPLELKVSALALILSPPVSVA